VVLSWTQGRSLNEETFIPFTIVAKEQVSATAFVLTVRPAVGSPSTLVRFFQATHYDSPGVGFFYWPLFLRGTKTNPHAAALAAAWSHGLWSVEIRQPQLQVARDYTPLPPVVRYTAGQSPEDDASAITGAVDAAELRFLIRRLPSGEVSSYLAGLTVGDQVDLRGPHLGFDIRKRLGSSHNVVFLAGGTGIAPAIQMARVVLEGSTTENHVSIVWANRERADCVGCPGFKTRYPTSQTIEDMAQNARDPIMRQLANLQARYQGRLSLRCTVDEERTFIDAPVIIKECALQTEGWFTKTADSSGTGRATRCGYHSQELLASQPETESEGLTCECGDVDGQSSGVGGKNLVFVSGPDGFILAFAGAKLWAGGQELQGRLGGVLGELRRRYPSFASDWLVLKL
jgi:ferredoxin-NADP reductase